MGKIQHLKGFFSVALVGSILATVDLAVGGESRSISKLQSACASGEEIRPGRCAGMDLRSLNPGIERTHSPTVRPPSLVGAYMVGAVMAGMDLSEADFSFANLSGVILVNADLSGANLTGANLWGANLSGTILCGTNFSGANLANANLSGPGWISYDTCPEKLGKANFSAANLIGAHIEGRSDRAFIPAGVITIEECPKM